MCAQILALATALPSYQIQQATFPETFCQSLKASENVLVKLKKICRNSKIKTRHTVVPDYLQSPIQGTLYPTSFPETIPSSQSRNEIFKQQAPLLAQQAAQAALDQWEGSPSAITHVLSVSCTGMMAPGIEFLLVDRLGLNRSCSRLAINFMGCFAAMQALEVAKSLAEENPSHRILMVCTELCSLHMQATLSTSQLVSNSLFADGAGALIIGSKKSTDKKPLWEIGQRYSLALDHSLSEMTWDIGNFGFSMHLSEKVPRRIKENLVVFASELTEKEIHKKNYDWAVHPGGKAILETFEEIFKLPKTALNHSWNILENCGNMSSATLLFVLENLYQKGFEHEETLAFAFGPGLSIEGIVLKNGK